MKRNQVIGNPIPTVPGAHPNLERMAAGIIRCVEQFNQEFGPPFEERCVSVAFGNAVYVYIKYSDRADALFAELQVAGFPGSRDAVAAAFQDFDAKGDWISNVAELVTKLWSATPHVAAGANVSARTFGRCLVSMAPDAQLPYDGWTSSTRVHLKFNEALLRRPQCVSRVL